MEEVDDAPAPPAPTAPNSVPAKPESHESPEDEHSELDHTELEHIAEGYSVMQKGLLFAVVLGCVAVYIRMNNRKGKRSLLPKTV
jgi:hypothetical protein